MSSGKSIWFNKEEFLAAVGRRRSAKQLSRNDTYLLLWVIHFATEGSKSQSKARKKLVRFSHVLIDEAQYYDPRLIRLFAELIEHPEENRKGVLTIVGDVEQRISADGGVLNWNELGLELKDDQIRRLVTNYRWSAEVFDFLEIVHREIAIEETLNRPFKWRVAGGKSPRICPCKDDTDVANKIVDSINAIRDEETTRFWHVAVIIPGGVERGQELSDILEENGIPSRWAVGSDVNSCVDKVVVTTFDDIVGLEFDAVILADTDYCSAKKLDDSSRSSLWVAVTRPKRFLQICCLPSDRLFTAPAFADYRSNMH